MESADSVHAAIQVQGRRIHHHDKKLTSVCLGVRGVRELTKRHESFQASIGSQVCLGLNDITIRNRYPSLLSLQHSSYCKVLRSLLSSVLEMHIIW